MEICRVPEAAGVHCHSNGTDSPGAILIVLTPRGCPGEDAEIEKIIRDQAAAISKELEGNPSPNEKISDKPEKEEE